MNKVIVPKNTVILKQIEDCFLRVIDIARSLRPPHGNREVNRLIPFPLIRCLAVECMTDSVLPGEIFLCLVDRDQARPRVPRMPVYVVDRGRHEFELVAGFHVLSAMISSNLPPGPAADSSSPRVIA